MQNKDFSHLGVSFRVLVEEDDAGWYAYVLLHGSNDPPIYVPIGDKIGPYSDAEHALDEGHRRGVQEAENIAKKSKD